MKLSITYGRLTFAIIAALFFLNVSASVAVDHANGFSARKLIGLGLMDQEISLPTLANYSLILLNSILLIFIAHDAFRTLDRWRWQWAVLGAIFFAMAYDEAAGIHEHLNELGRYLVDAQGFLYFSWVVPAGLVVAVVGFAYLPFLFGQPRRRAVLMTLAGAIYVTGAIGVEMIGANFAFVHAPDTFRHSTVYNLIAGVEETMEMSGMALFGYALLRTIEERKSAGK